MSKRLMILTLISLNGMSKLFSSLESNPKMQEASLKLRFVAAKAFMIAYEKNMRDQEN